MAMKNVDADRALEKLPKGLVSKLMPFQKDGIIFAIGKKGRCLIADEMGLGKTIQAISVAYYYKDEWPLLIIVPSSLRYCWIEELEKWLPDIHPHDINLIQAGNDVGEISSAKVTIITYGLLSHQRSGIVKEALLSKHFNVVICDESHYIRNTKTATSKAVVPIIKNAHRRILLSGTPALSKPVELYPQLDSLCPGEFGSWWSFTTRYCAARFEFFGRQKRRVVDGASNLEELQAKLCKMVMIRREKSAVLTQLPPKQRQKILFELKDSSLKKEIISTFDELKPHLSRSRNLTCELFDNGATEEIGNENKDNTMLGLISKLYRLSAEAKIGPAKDYIGMLCENESLKFLIFAHHRVMLNGIQQTLWDKKVKFIRIDGDTQPSDRLMYVQQFQSDPEIRVALLSILAAGVGLTFTAAKLVVFAEMHWTPGVLVQCEDRAHRIGQTGCVQVHYLVAKATMDEWVWSSICRKTVVTTTALSGRGKNLEADKGDKYQVDVLSNADAWVPSKQSDMDFTSFFQSQRSSDQRCIKDFFTPPPSGKHKRRETDKSENSLSVAKSGGRKRSLNRSGDSSVKKKQKTDSVVCSFVILDSDEEEFVVSNKVKSKKSWKFEKIKHRKCSSRSSPDSSFEFEIPDFNLSTSNTSENSENSSPNVDGLCDSSVKCLNKTEKSDVKDLIKCSEKSQEMDLTIENCDDSAVKNVPDFLHSTESIPATNEIQWACSLCTFLNHIDVPVCEMCDNPKIKLKTKSTIKDNSNINKSSTVHPDIISSSPKSKIMMKGNRGEKKSQVASPGNVDLLTQISSEIETKTDFLQAEMNNACISQEQSIPCSFKKNSTSVLATQSVGVFQTELVHTDVKSDTESCISQTTDNNLDVGAGSESLFSGSEETVMNGINYSTFCDETDSHDDVNQDMNDSDIKLASQDYAVCDVHKTELISSPVSGELPVIQEPRSRHKNTPRRNAFHSCVNSCEDGLCLEEYERELHRRHIVGLSRTVETLSDTCMSSHELKSGNSTQVICKSSQTNVKQLFEVRSPHSATTSEETMLTPDGDGLCLSLISNENSDFQKTPDKSTGIMAGTGDAASEDISDCSMLQAQRMGHGLTTSTPKLKSVETTPGCCPVSSSFLYCCSRYTGRVYLFDSAGEALNVNFLPLDIEMDNICELPEILQLPAHLRQVQKFTREWNCLSDTKKRLITKRGLIFNSPLLAYEEVRTGNKTNTQRHKTKEDIAKTAQHMANEVNGSVRLIRNPTQKTTSHQVEKTNEGDTAKGCLQAVTSAGVPLCLNCQGPYRNNLLQQSTIINTENAWATRFCSKSCMDTHWMKTNSGYCRDKVYEVEHGVCQLCGVDAHALYSHIRDTADLEERARILSASKFSSMKSRVKEQMVKNPVAGQFWHADHIRPVWEGGGMCDIDNMRTLCTVCHLKVTSKQASKRATVRKLANAAGSGDITAFFQKS
ncbi:DNA annealing helicase and endonuclease ZRANB3-like [Gigantopelta aegis]|uniref:DNA annealing helicase and endonuclease ZRANB3-like n=1 Tax=Gigantopelta aegis TaxID=1735272 RepID=UPI001B8892A2|nr:DNA annealing helicase and endonuclease ZRANB3-like [Gigantopelta aegis]